MAKSSSDMGRDWAYHCIKWDAEPTTTGNVAHDRACAETYLKLTGRVPSWYDKERFGEIMDPNNPYKTWNG